MSTDTRTHTIRVAAWTSLAWLLALLLGGMAGYRALANAVPPEPPMVFRGFDSETITVEDIVDETEPHMQKFIDSEVPWGMRWAAHKLLRWQVRATIRAGIALHGHQISGALEVIEPLSNTLFRPEPAARIRAVRKLCDVDVSEFGAVAVEARESVGPVGAIGQ